MRAAETGPSRPGWRAAAYAGAALILMAVFAAYRHPELVRDVAALLWSCF